MKVLNEDLQKIAQTGNRTNYAQNGNIIAASLWNVQELRNLQKTTERQIKTQEDTKKSLENLTATIEKLDKKNGVLQQGIFWLTGALFLLGAIQIILAVLPHK